MAFFTSSFMSARWIKSLFMITRLVLPNLTAEQSQPSRLICTTKSHFMQYLWEIFENSFQNFWWPFIQVKGSLLYKYGNIYREVMHSPRADWCTFLNVKKEDNLMLYQMVIIVKDRNPSLVHECPYWVQTHFMVQKTLYDVSF